MKNGAVTYIYTGEGMNWNLLRVRSPHLLCKICKTSLLLIKEKSKFCLNTVMKAVEKCLPNVSNLKCGWDIFFGIAHTKCLM